MRGVNGVDPYELTMLEVNCVMKGQFHKGIIEKLPFLFAKVISTQQMTKVAARKNRTEHILY